MSRLGANPENKTGFKDGLKDAVGRHDSSFHTDVGGLGTTFSAWRTEDKEGSVGVPTCRAQCQQPPPRAE